MIEHKCPFCGEPAMYKICGGKSLFRCGTEGPYHSTDGSEEYRTGHDCDISTYRRLLAAKDAEIESMQAQLNEATRFAKLWQTAVSAEGSDWADGIIAEQAEEAGEGNR